MHMRKWPQNNNVGEIRIRVYSTSPLISKALKDHQFDHRSLCGYSLHLVFIYSLCVSIRCILLSTSIHVAMSLLL